MPQNALAQAIAHNNESPSQPRVTVESWKLDELIHQNELFRSALDALPGGVVLFDRTLRLVFCNQAFKELLEYPDSLFEFGPPTLEQIFRFNATRGEYGPGRIEDLVAQKLKLVSLMRAHAYERTRPNGTVLEVRGAPLANGGFVTTYFDITHERVNRNAEGEEVALDGLTKLPKREFIERQLWFALKKRQPSEVACLHCFDLDEFGKVNQLYGHEVGDKVLQEVAKRLSSTIRGFDFIARAGGDRFLVLQSSVTRPSQIARLASRLHEEIKKPMTIDDKVLKVNASFGMALAPRDGTEVEVLLAKAEEMALKSKVNRVKQIDLSAIDWEG